MKKVVETAATKKQVEKVLKSEQSKSAKIKELFHMGIEVKQIAELMQIRYNFAYNVVSNMMMTSEEAIEVTSKKDQVSKKDQIIKLHEEGKSNKEIAIELKTNYNYVFNTLKAYKQSKAE